MINLTIKTLDSQNHAFSLDDDITVRQLKEHIADSVNISADLQRLIYCGRVLQDEKNLSEYDVNGKVVHLVQRAPPSLQQRSNNAGQNQSRDSRNGEFPSSPRVHYRQTQFHGNPMYVGSLSIPADVLEGHGEMQLPQLRETMVNSHVTVIRRMLDQANNIMDRLENRQTDNSDRSAAPTTANTEETEATGTDNEEVSSEATNEPSNNEEQSSEPVAGSSTTPSSTVKETVVPRQMAELLENLLTTQERLRPFITNHMLSSTSANTEETQRIADGVSECFHFLSHAQHALSNFKIDMQQQQPRTLRCRPMVIQPSAILQAGLPIQVEAHISLHGQADHGNTEADSTGSNQPQAPSATTSPPPTSSSSDSPTPQSTNDRPQNPRTETQSASPFSQVFNFPSNQVEVVMEMAERAPRVWSFSAGGQGNNDNNSSNDTDNATNSNNSSNLGSTNNQNNQSNNTNQNTNNNNSTNNNSSSSTTGTATGFSFGAAPTPDIIRNLMQAVAGYMAQTGVPITVPPSTLASTPTNINNVTNSRRSGRTGDADDTTPLLRSNTDTHPTTSTQTRTTSRTHVFHQHAQALGVGVNVAHHLDFDPFLPCNSQHIRRNQQQRSQPSDAASTQTGRATSATDNTSAPSASAGSTTSGPRFATITGVQIINSAANRPSLAELLNRPNVEIPFHELLTSRDINLIRRDQSFESRSDSRRARHITAFERIYRVLSKLTITQWRCIINGDYSPLTRRVQLDLQAALYDVPPSESLTDLPEGVSQSVINDLRNYIERTFDGEHARDDNGTGVLLGATIENLLRIHIPNIVRSAFVRWGTSQNVEESVIQHIKAFIIDLVGICRLTLRGGQEGFERVAARFASLVTRDTNEVFRQWILGTVVEWICNYTRTMTTFDKEALKKLLIHSDKPECDKSEANASNAAAPTVSTHVEAQSQPEPMETDSGPDPLMLDNSEIVSTFPGHENLLPDWVPIIARDGPRQRRQLQLGLSGGSVTTLSDAYLATMPSKRRKLVEQQKPTLLVSPTSSNSSIPASMERLVRESVSHAGVEEVDGAAAAVAADPTVRRAFGQAVRECLHTRRYQTPDFPDSLRFPNASKFFNPNAGPDQQ